MFSNQTYEDDILWEHNTIVEVQRQDHITQLLLHVGFQLK